MRLRDVVESDLAPFFEHQSDPAGYRMAQVKPRDHDAFLHHWRTRVLATATSIVRTIDVDGCVAGYVSSWEDGDGRREVGYSLGRAYWGRGIATAALRDFVAEHDTARPLFAVVAVPNVASRRVLEKCGFSTCGELSIAHDAVLEMKMRLD